MSIVKPIISRIDSRLVLPFVDSVAGVSTPVVEGDITSGLTGHWDFETWDSSAVPTNLAGTSAVLTLNTNLANYAGKNPAGKIGNCLDFLATWPTNYFGTFTNLASVLAVSLWFRTKDTTFNAPIFWNVNEFYSLKLVYWGSLEYSSDAGTIFSDINDYFYSNTKITDTNWHHLLVNTESDGMYLYIDGVMQTQMLTSNAVGLDNLGCSSGGSSNVGMHQIDQFRAYNRSLAAADIATLYNGGAGV